MSPFLFGFQIFITILVSLIIVFQKSSSDGIVSSNSGSQVSSRSQTMFISKITVMLIFIFMMNSIFLARESIDGSNSIIKSLENEIAPKYRVKDENNVPKME